MSIPPTSVADMSESTALVPISEERLRALEALEADLPSRIETAVKEYKLNALKRLHERDKQNPAAVNLRAKRYAERHREEINARRRAKRAEKKMLDAQGRSATPAATAARPEDAALHTRIVRTTVAAVRRRAVAAPVVSAAQTIVGSFASAAAAQQPCPVGEVTLRFDM
jgi:hypothetical protein